MKKLKLQLRDLKLKLLAHKLVMIGIGVLLVGTVAVKAYQDNITVQGDYYAAPAETVADVPQVETDEKFGAFPGNNFDGDFVSYNGMKEYYRYEKLQTATTTICSLVSPVETSVLAAWFVGMSTSSTVATQLSPSQATGRSATTTLIGAATIAIDANAQKYVSASSTDLSDADTIFPGSTSKSARYYFNIGMQGNAGTFSPVGHCGAIFRVIE